jgi:hypothetical protein
MSTTADGPVAPPGEGGQSARQDRPSLLYENLYQSTGKDAMRTENKENYRTN